MSGLAVRAPRRDEVSRVWELVNALAVYEKLEHEVGGDAPALEADLFATPPRVECRVAERDGRLVGYALFYSTYSSFRTRPGVWLEDLFVEPSERGRGTGRALLAEVARISLARGGRGVSWVVLDWNRPSIDFYERLGAARTGAEWYVYAIGGEAIERLAAGKPPPD